MIELGTIFESTFSKDGDWVESKDQDENGDIRLIQLADIAVNRFTDKSNRFMTYDKAIELNCSFLQHNDILIARMPDPIGRCGLFPYRTENKFVPVEDVCIARPVINNDPKYLMYAINSPNTFQQIVKFVREQLEKGFLEKILLKSISPSVQRRIAAILDPVDAHRRKTEALIEKYDELAQSIFLEMFGDPVRNEKGWEKILLGEAGKLAEVPIPFETEGDW